MATYVRETVELHGSFPDLIPQDAPATGWNNTNNVYFLNGETRRVAGDLPVMGTPLTDPRTVCFYTDAAGQPYWVYAGPGGIYCTDGVNHFDITPATGWTPEATGIYTSSSYNGFVIINCTTERPVYWPGTPASKCLPLPGWPNTWRCMSIRPHEQFLFAVGMLNEAGFQRVRWSDAAEAGTMPQQWEATAENLAGFVDCLPSHSPCIDGHTCRDAFLVFKGQSIHEFVFVGGNTVFNARRLFTGVGLAGVNGVTDGPSDQLLFAGSDGDWYKTDGVQYASVLEGIAQQTFYSESDEDLLGKLASVTLSRLSISWLFYPMRGETIANRAICYTWATGEVSFRDMQPVFSAASGRLLSDATLQNSWDGAVGVWNTDRNVWNYSLSGSTGEDVIAGVDGASLLAFENSDIEANPLPGYAIKQGLAFGDAQRRKMVKAIWPKVRGALGDQILIRAGGQETTNGPVTWSDAQPYVIGSGLPVETFVEGRYLALEVSSENGSPWALGTIDVEFRGLGLW
ncbi:MAG: hypothetical protein QM699_06830 [Amaricoccus sp.]|uniref:hypothetical protein n=1 Tax=Amaricoccus sp. TaxID=1872485 RepID=UPI0039E554AC